MRGAATNRISCTPPMLRCNEDLRQTVEMGQKLPRHSLAGAAAIPPITDGKADVRRGRDGPGSDDLTGGPETSLPVGLDV